MNSYQRRRLARRHPILQHPNTSTTETSSTTTTTSTYTTLITSLYNTLQHRLATIATSRLFLRLYDFADFHFRSLGSLAPSRCNTTLIIIVVVLLYFSCLNTLPVRLYRTGALHFFHRASRIAPIYRMLGCQAFNIICSQCLEHLLLSSPFYYSSTTRLILVVVVVGCWLVGWFVG